MRGVHSMKLIDYTGQLNNHNEYLKVIKQLEKKCKNINSHECGGSPSF